MKIVLIAIALLVVACVVFEIVSKIVAKREKARWDKLPPDEQRKEQERLYKKHQL